MGCFGDMTPTKQVDSTSTSTTSPEAWVENAGQQNYAQARGVLDQGFVPYTGQMTAPLSSNEQQASGLVNQLAGSGNPYTTTAAQDFTNYGAAPATNYNFNTVADQTGPLGTTQSYMDPYIQAALAPTLQQINLSGSQARQGIAANATQSGAYGDARHGVVEAQQLKDQSTNASNATAQAYSAAYNSAMSQREQDAARQLSTQQAQQGANETALNRTQQSGIDLTNLDKYNTSRDLGVASALGQTGATERSVNQASDDAQMSEFMRQNGFTDQQVALLTQILAGTPTAKTTTGSGTQVTSQPNNSGWQAIGSLAGALLLGPFGGGVDTSVPNNGSGIYTGDPTVPGFG